MLISWLWLDEKLSQLFLMIDSALYSAVAWLYEIFLAVAKTEIFSNEIYDNFAQRVYVVLGVVMLFVLAYELLQVIINPDNLTKGDKSFSKVASKLVVSLVIIGLLPTAFDYSRKLQNFILNNNVIGTLLFGVQEMDVTVREYTEDGKDYTETTKTLTASEVAESKVNSYGRVMALTSLNAFLNPENQDFQYDAGEFTTKNGYVNVGSVIGCIAGGAAGAGITIFTFGAGVGAGLGVAAVACGVSGATVNSLGNALDYSHYSWNDIRFSIMNTGDFTQIISLAKVLQEGAKSVDGSGTVEISYTPLISSLCALVMIYLLTSFCIDLGIRSVRLAFLQLIAPVPIFMRAMPGKGAQFDKWLKKTLATYMEVFIRVFLMYMAVYFLSNIHVNLNTWQGLWVNVVLIMGVIAFVKEAPKLIADITGIDSGNMKLGIMPKLAAGGALSAAALIGGGVTAAVRNGTNAFQNVAAAWNRPDESVTSRIFSAARETGRGILSTGAGGLSGAVRGGYRARGAKNIADVRSSARTAASDTVSARARREAYRVAHPGNVGRQQIIDMFDNVKEWAGGGFEAEENKLKFYNDTLTLQNTADEEAKKLLERNVNNDQVVITPDKMKSLWKGSAEQVNTYQRLFEEKFQYRDEQGNLRVLKRSQDVADLQSAIAQIEKSSWMQLQSAAYDSDLQIQLGFTKKDANGNVVADDSKLLTIRSNMDKINNKMESFGENKINFSSDAGKQLDDTMKDLKASRDRLAADVERKKEARAARQSNQGNSGKK